MGEKMRKVALLIILIGLLGASLTFLLTKRGSGDSMLPTIQSGDSFFCSPFLPKNLTGQIITYKTPEINICHRAVSDNGTYVITKGDNNNAADPPVPKEDIEGVVFLITPGYVPYCILTFSLTIIWITILTTILTKGRVATANFG